MPITFGGGVTPEKAYLVIILMFPVNIIVLKDRFTAGAIGVEPSGPARF